MQIDLGKYQKFVEAVTSKESNSIDSFIVRLENLTQENKFNPSLLLTAGVGLASESGEFNEIIKKIMFQGKPVNEETVFHMKRELGDIIWYWINACRALNFNPNEVIAENVNKLSSRYPSGEFNAYHSENRKTGDI